MHTSAEKQYVNENKMETWGGSGRKIKDCADNVKTYGNLLTFWIMINKTQIFFDANLFICRVSPNQ
jgi:hypothetical protein